MCSDNASIQDDVDAELIRTNISPLILSKVLYKSKNTWCKYNDFVLENFN